MSQIINDIIEELKKIIKNEEFKELFYLLSRGDYAIELNFSKGISDDIEKEYDEVPVGYIFNNRLIEDRFDYFNMKKSKKKGDTLPIEEVAKDISLISKELESIYSIGLFDNLQGMLLTWFEDFKEKHENVDCSPYIDFRVKGISVLGIDYLEHDEIDMGLTDINEILEKLPQNIEVSYIPNLPWFNKLSRECQNLIQAGTNLIKQVLFKKEENLFIDYSTLLLDFIKALESEILDHYLLYYDGIENLAKLISDQNAYPKNKNNEDRIKNLKRITKAILRYKKDYRPNGLLPVYHLLKYYALGEDIKLTVPFSSYLPADFFNYLRKQRKVIERLENLGADRNEYIHQKFIESEDEFKMYYNDLMISLKILSDLKPQIK